MKDQREIAKKLKELYQQYEENDMPALEQIKAIAWAADAPVELVLELLDGQTRQTAAEPQIHDQEQSRELEEQILRLSEEVDRLKKEARDQTKQHKKELALISKKAEEEIQKTTESLGGAVRSMKFELTASENEKQAMKESRNALQNKVEELTKELEETKLLREEYDTLKASMKELKEQKDIAERKARAMKTAMKNRKTQGSAVLLYGREKNLYFDEIPGILVDILEEALSTCPENSRRYTVINDILNANTEVRNIQKDRSDVIKYIFKNSKSIDERMISQLEEQGVEAEKMSKHILLTLGGDKRFAVTTAITPSDHMAAANTAAAVIKTMF